MSITGAGGSTEIGVIYPPLESILMDIVVRQRILLDTSGYWWLLLVIVGCCWTVLDNGIR